MSERSVQRPMFGVVLLAAGRSTRMGTPKLLLPWAGTTVLGHLIEQWAALGSAQTAVVCAAADPRITAELDRLHFPKQNRIFNPAPDRGMFSSVQCAAAWRDWEARLSYWAIVLGDQPHLQPATLEALLAFTARHPTSVCLPSRGSRPKHPVLLPGDIFRALSSTTTSTLKEFLSGYELALCEIEDPALELDIDNPADYERALRLTGQVE